MRRATEPLLVAGIAVRVCAAGKREDSEDGKHCALHFFSCEKDQ